MQLSIDQAWLESTMLASVRIIAFLTIAPPFSHRAIPPQVRVILAVGLALAVSNQVSAGYEPADTTTFVGYLVSEALTGAMIGALVMITFSAITAAGAHIDLFGGFSLGMALDPQSNVNGAQFSRLFALAATVLMFTSEAYQLVVLGLTRSYRTVPLGAVAGVPAESFVDALVSSFLAGVQIAGPLVVVLFLADAGLGLVNRVAPALNAFAMGFPLKIFLTLTLVGTVFVVLPQVVSALTEDALGYVGVIR